MVHNRIAGPRRLLPLCVLFLLLNAPTVPAAETGGMDLASAQGPDADRVPTGARRAAEWRPSHEGVVGAPWHFSATAGLAFFAGDDAIDDRPGFGAELSVSRDLASEFYVAGAYLLGFARTEVEDPLGGSADSDTEVLHALTLGVGFRGELSPEVSLFVEPKIGAVIGGDDAGPAGGASAGLDIELQPGLAVRVNFTGLFTDTDVETPAGDANLNGVFTAGVGLVFEF